MSSPSDDLAPLKLIETKPGKFSLLLSTFAPADEVFVRHGLEGGGYSWEAIARHFVESDGSELAGRLNFDPEADMFCAYGEDRDALAELGARLAGVFRDLAKLDALIGELGPDSFDD